MPKQLLIVANTPSDNTLLLAMAVEQGARQGENGDGENGDAGQGGEQLRVIRLQPMAADAAAVLAADALILGTTENFGYMSGQMKDFFERVYYPCLEKTQGKPWALYIRAGKDGNGTSRAVTAIVSGLRWRQIQEPTLLRGDFNAGFVGQCKTLGETMAAGLRMGVF